MRLRWYRTWRTVWYSDGKAGGKSRKGKEPVYTLQYLPGGFPDAEGYWRDVETVDAPAKDPQGEGEA